VSYIVRVLPRAKDDLEAIFHYIEERSPLGAIRWEEALESGFSKLNYDPLVYGLAPENKHFDFELRQLLFKTPRGRNYRIVFRVEEMRVFVLRICGPGQAPLNSDDMPKRSKQDTQG